MQEIVLEQTVGEHLNGEPQTHLAELDFSAVLLSLQLLLPVGQKISSAKLLCDLFFNEDSNISPMIVHSQPHIEHMLGEKRTTEK